MAVGPLGATEGCHLFLRKTRRDAQIPHFVEVLIVPRPGDLLTFQDVTELKASLLTKA